MSRVLWEQPDRSGGRRPPAVLGVVVALAAAGVLALLGAAGVLGGDGRLGDTGGAAPTARASPPPPEGRLEIRDAPAATEGGSGQQETRLLGGGWRRLPHAPLVRRHGHSTVWTGSHLIVWGGARTDERHHGTGLTALRSGASYDPVDGRWRRLPASPLDGRVGHVAVAADGNMVVWGGQREDGAPAAASYDPAAMRWERLPAGPIDAARPRGAAWTGERVLVWGDRDGRWVAAAYDPATGAWERLGDPPIAASGATSDAVWVDGALVLWQPPATGQRARLASWSAEEARWRLHRPLDGAPGPVRLLAAGEHVLAWGGPPAGRWAVSYHPSSRVREPVSPPPLDPQGELVAGWDGEALLVWSATDNRTLRVDPATGAVTALPDSPLAPRSGAGGDSWPGGLVVWGGAGPERHYDDGAVLDVEVASSD